MENQVVCPGLEPRLVTDLEGAKIPPMQAPRSHLLLSCGTSVLAVAHKAYQRVETMSCPVGCLARGVSHMAAPILSPLQLRCLSALSFFDRQFAVVQDVAAVLFPRSEGVFRKVDDLVLLVESLPVKFDGAVDGLEALVACTKSGITGFAPRRCCCRVDEGDDDVFRDIRCDDEEEAALHRATADDEVMLAMEKRCEDATRKVERVEVVVTVDGSDGDDDGGAGDPTKTIGAGPAEKIIGEDHEHDEKAEGDVVQDACEKATLPETDQPDVSSEVAERTFEAESNGEANLVKRNISSGGEERVKGLEREGRPMEVAEGAETHAAEIMEAMQSTEIVNVGSQEVSSQEGGASESEMMGDAISGSGRDSEDALLYLFDEAWQQKLA